MFPKEGFIKVKQQRQDSLLAFYIECSATVEGCQADLKNSVCPYEKVSKLPADTSSAGWSDNSQFETNIPIIQCFKCCLCAVPYEKEVVELKKFIQYN